MRKAWVLAAAVAVVGCGGNSRSRGGGGTGSGGGTGGGNVGGMGATLFPDGPDADHDHDGFTKNTGDCDDTQLNVSPMSIDLAGNEIDDDCNGVVDDPQPSCDPINRASDAQSLAQALEQCDHRFFKSVATNGPSDQRARAVVNDYGVIKPKAGANMIALSSGVAADADDQGYVVPQSGTDLGNTFANPLPSVPPNGLCAGAGMTGGQPAQVNDYTELVLKLVAPQNVTSFSFNFYFMSAEYPEFVCDRYNDSFLVMMESPNEFQTASNIAFDMQKNPVTVNNGFFTVCTSDTSHPYTNHCTMPVSGLTGTGYETLQGSQPIGGGTGWLTTTAPVTPLEEITLRFIVFDEGDGILDSAVLIDNFQWGTQTLDAPTTIQ